jgi:RHS repeat-associated protein
LNVVGYIKGADAKRDELWTLSQTGLWTGRKLDLDGDLNYNEAGELNENNPLSGGTAYFNAAYYFAYDDRWRIVATYRNSDTSPKEQFVYHNAGAGGWGGGGSSYIDLVILRDKDANTAWTAAADGTLEERRYYCQNWRADVSVILKSTGYFVERIKYSAYGTPFGLPAGDTDSDGDCNGVDAGGFYPASYDVRFDLDLDGDNDATDYTDTLALSGTTLGYAKLSRPDTANRKGYAGYEYDGKHPLYHVRARVLYPLLGRWTRRDPIGCLLPAGLYAYADASPVKRRDPSGLHPDWDDCVDDSRSYEQCLDCCGPFDEDLRGCVNACGTRFGERPSWLACVLASDFRFQCYRCCPGFGEVGYVLCHSLCDQLRPPDDFSLPGMPPDNEPADPPAEPPFDPGAAPCKVVSYFFIGDTRCCVKACVTVDPPSIQFIVVCPCTGEDPIFGEPPPEHEEVLPR